MDELDDNNNNIFVDKPLDYSNRDIPFLGETVQSQYKILCNHTETLLQTVQLIINPTVQNIVRENKPQLLLYIELLEAHKFEIFNNRQEMRENIQQFSKQLETVQELLKSEDEEKELLCEELANKRVELKEIRHILQESINRMPEHPNKYVDKSLEEMTQKRNNYLVQKQKYNESLVLAQMIQDHKGSITDLLEETQVNNQERLQYKQLLENGWDPKNILDKFCVYCKKIITQYDNQVKYLDILIIIQEQESEYKRICDYIHKLDCDVEAKCQNLKTQYQQKTEIKSCIKELENKISQSSILEESNDKVIIQIEQLLNQSTTEFDKIYSSPQEQQELLDLVSDNEIKQVHELQKQYQAILELSKRDQKLQNSHIDNMKQQTKLLQEFYKELRENADLKIQQSQEMLNWQERLCTQLTEIMIFQNNPVLLEFVLTTLNSLKPSLQLIIENLHVRKERKDIEKITLVIRKNDNILSQQETYYTKLSDKIVEYDKKNSSITNQHNLSVYLADSLKLVQKSDTCWKTLESLHQQLRSLQDYITEQTKLLEKCNKLQCWIEEKIKCQWMNFEKGFNTLEYTCQALLSGISLDTEFKAITDLEQSSHATQIIQEKIQASQLIVEPVTTQIIQEKIQASQLIVEPVTTQIIQEKIQAFPILSKTNNENQAAGMQLKILNNILFKANKEVEKKFNQSRKEEILELKHQARNPIFSTSNQNLLDKNNSLKTVTYAIIDQKIVDLLEMMNKKEKKLLWLILTRFLHNILFHNSLA